MEAKVSETPLKRKVLTLEPPFAHTYPILISNSFATLMVRITPGNAAILRHRGRYFLQKVLVFGFLDNLSDSIPPSYIRMFSTLYLRSDSTLEVFSG